jgi:hypothetical protein
MNEWMLTKEEVEIAAGGLPGCVGKSSEQSIHLHKHAAELIAKAQARKIVEWIWQDCKDDKHHHRNFTDTGNRMKEAFRKDCHTCMFELRKEVGL